MPMKCDGCKSEGVPLDLHFPGGEAAYLCRKCGKKKSRCPLCRKLVTRMVLQPNSKNFLCLACNRRTG